MEITSSFEMIRTNPAHIGSSPVQPVGKVGRVTSVSRVQPLQIENKNVTKVSRSFDSYLLDAMQYVNNKQIASSDIAEKFILDPDSVDVHDVTTAMAEASLSLSLAQKVIDGLVKDWSEITTTR